MVAVLLPNFSIPRDIIHVWLASTTTTTFSPINEETVSAICLVSLSWTWSLTPKKCTIVCKRDFSISNPGEVKYPMWTTPWNGSKWCSHCDRKGKFSSECSVLLSLEAPFVPLQTKPFSFFSMLLHWKFISHFVYLPGVPCNSFLVGSSPKDLRIEATAVTIRGLISSFLTETLEEDKEGHQHWSNDPLSWIWSLSTPLQLRRPRKSSQMSASLFWKAPEPAETSIPCTPLWCDWRVFDSMSGKGRCLHWSTTATPLGWIPSCNAEQTWSARRWGSWSCFAKTLVTRESLLNPKTLWPEGT